jgi:hypothetical protein
LRSQIAALAAIILCLSFGYPASADEIVVPVAIYARGLGLTSWSTEIRVRNSTPNALSFRVVDYVGNNPYGFNPATFSVAPGEMASYGAWALHNSTLGCGGFGGYEVEFGAFTIQADPGLAVQAAVLAGGALTSATGPADCSYFMCRSWQGGYPVHGALCNEGAGPVFDNARDYFPAGSGIVLPWLHTHDTRRTNITFYNADNVGATVSLTITPGDGTNAVAQTITVPAHGVMQLNNIFSSPPFDAVRAHNGSTTAAASATITSTTRLYAIAWIIANLNSTVSVSQPR